MKRFVIQIVLVFLGLGIVAGVATVISAPARPIISIRGKASRELASKIASSYSGARIRSVRRSDRYNTSYLLENSLGGRASVVVNDGAIAPGWHFCSEGDRITLSVKDFPVGGFWEWSAAKDGVEYFLTPICSTR